MFLKIVEKVTDLKNTLITPEAVKDYMLKVDPPRGKLYNSSVNCRGNNCELKIFKSTPAEVYKVYLDINNIKEGKAEAKITTETAVGGVMDEYEAGELYTLADLDKLIKIVKTMLPKFVKSLENLGSVDYTPKIPKFKQPKNAKVATVAGNGNEFLFDMAPKVAFQELNDAIGEVIGKNAYYSLYKSEKRSNAYYEINFDIKKLPNIKKDIAITPPSDDSKFIDLLEHKKFLIYIDFKKDYLKLVNKVGYDEEEVFKSSLKKINIDDFKRELKDNLEKYLKYDRPVVDLNSKIETFKTDLERAKLINTIGLMFKKEAKVKWDRDYVSMNTVEAYMYIKKEEFYLELYTEESWDYICEIKNEDTNESLGEFKAKGMTIKQIIDKLLEMFNNR